MAITLTVEGLVPGTEGAQTIEDLVTVFEEALNLALKKEQAYGGAWREQGWMGNIARILSKSARLKSLCWTETLKEYGSESVEDTAMDLMNIAAFALVNFRRGNRWGR